MSCFLAIMVTHIGRELMNPCLAGRKKRGRAFPLGPMILPSGAPCPCRWHIFWTPVEMSKGTIRKLVPPGVPNTMQAMAAWRRWGGGSSVTHRESARGWKAVPGFGELPSWMAKILHLPTTQRTPPLRNHRDGMKSLTEK